MLKVSFVEWTRGEYDDVWIVYLMRCNADSTFELVLQIRYTVLKGTEEKGESVNADFAKEMRQCSRKYGAVFERVTCSRWCLCPITEYPHFAVRAARQVCGIIQQERESGRSKPDTRT